MPTSQTEFPQPAFQTANGEPTKTQQYSRRIRELVMQAKQIETTLEMQRILVDIQLCAEAIEGNNRAIELLERGEDEVNSG